VADFGEKFLWRIEHNELEAARLHQPGNAGEHGFVVIYEIDGE
jgi:hypothetical protein